MMPWVTLSLRPSGWPIATTHWPTSTLSESPKVRKGRGSDTEIWMTARSVLGSVPTTLPGNCLPSDSRTWIWVAPATTWLLVRMWPSLSMRIPEPMPTISFLYFLGMFLGMPKK